MSGQICEEVQGADFGDQRLSHRLVKVVEELSEAPHLSIPAATNGRAEMEAAYRFFDNQKVSPEKIRQPHVAATVERMAQCDVVLLVQDTTELDLTRPSRQVCGAGPMDCDSRRGAFHHPLIAFRADGVPLGTLWHKTWTRESINTSLSKSQKQTKRRRTPIEDKESVRWIEGLREARAVAAQCPQTQCVCVSDSEADIYEMFSEPRQVAAVDNSSEREVELVIRAGQSRSTTTGDWLKDVQAMKELNSYSVKVSARTAKISVTKSPRSKSREAREATVSIQSRTVTLKPPSRPGRKLPPLDINVVLVEEKDPPEGCDAIQWLLATTLPIETLEHVERVVSIYCQRWQVEVYFRTLKSGCHVESRQFETLRRVENSLAVYSIIAWRVMYLCYLGRTCPDLSCEVLFSPSEWKSICHIHTGGNVPATAPTLNEFIRMVSGFGGYVDRPTTNPGTQTLWIGLHHLHCFALAWDTFGPDS